MSRPDAGWDPLDPAELRDTFGRIDPVPADLLERLSRAFELRRHDTELARLADVESAAPDRAIDPSDADEQFNFVSARCTVTALLSSTDSGEFRDELVLTGTVEHATPAAFLVETPRAVTAGIVTGQTIRAQGLRRGPTRMCLVMAGEPEPWLLETEWVTL